jgi:hypothetical protein
MAVGDRSEARLNDSSAAATVLGTTTTTICTVPTGYQYIVKQVIICNTDGIDRLVSLAIGSAGTVANRFVSLLPIAASDTTVLDTGIVLNAGETIQGLSDAASKVNVTVVGWTKQVA